MTRAVLIAGNSRRFFDETLRFRAYLFRDAGITDIQTFKTAYLTSGEAEAMLRASLLQSPDEPLVVLFAGHGGRDGWSLCDGETFMYATLAAILRERTAPTTIINDCCHAHAAAAAFEKCGVNEERVSLLSAAGSDEVAYTGLAAAVAERWRGRQEYEPRTFRVRDVIIRFETVEGVPPWRAFADALAERVTDWLAALSPSRFSTWGTIRAWRTAEQEVETRIARAERRWGAKNDGHFFPTRKDDTEGRA